MGWAVAVDDEPRVALHDQMGVEMFRERLRDAGNADVPGDMARQFALRQAEVAEPVRNESSIMVAREQKRRAAGGVKFAHRRNIFGPEE